MGITVYESERGQPGLVVHRSRVDPVPRAESRIQPAGKDIIDDLVRGAAPGNMVLWCAAGLRAGLLTCPMVGLPAAVEAAGSRAAVGRRGSDRVSDP